MRGYEKSPLNQQYCRTFGGTLGGAIIKDKLFYFVSAEAKKESYPSSIYPGYTDSYITNDVAKRIADQYKKLTGFDEVYNQRDVESKSFGLLARIRLETSTRITSLALRYQHNNSYDDNSGLKSSTYTFGNSGYRMNNKTNAIGSRINSHLGQNLYNKLQSSASFIRDHRDVAYQGPTVQIKNTLRRDQRTTNTFHMGPEYSSGADYFNQDIYTFEQLVLVLGPAIP